MTAVIAATVVIILRVQSIISTDMHVIEAVKHVRIKRPRSPVSDEG